MRKSIVIAAAAVIGLGSTLAGTQTASATPVASLQTLVNQNATIANRGVQEVRWRGHRYRGRDWGDAAAAGIVGFGLGAILGSALTPRYNYPRAYGYYGYPRAYGYYPRTYAYGGPTFAYGGAPAIAYGGMTSAHVQWCLQRYRSYDVGTDTFLSYDGNRYRCNSPY